jgi:DNA-binding IclR family transcriptional regulator
VARHIQSIERAVAVLRVLGSAPHELTLQEIADSLGLAKPTAHGILATLRHVGMVEQDRRTGHYRVTRTENWLPRGGMDPHLLRSHAMNWADSLAATAGEAVLIGVPDQQEVEVVHHVFCPDGSPQRLMYGDRQPPHATALGKVLLAFTRWWQLRVLQAGRGSLERYTARTVVDPVRLRAEVDAVRRRGYAVEVAEHHPGVVGVAAPIRAFGGLGVGAIALVGPLDRMLVDSSAPAAAVRPSLLEGLLAAAASVSEQLEQPW